MLLNDEVVRSFRVTERHDTEQIHAIDFSGNGQLLVSCSDGDKIRVYSSGKGEHLDTIHSQKYGVGLIRFANAKNTVLHSSTKVDNAIRYLGLENRHYLRYYPEHTDKVTSISVSSRQDIFLSASLDKTVRLWDLRMPDSVAMLTPLERPIAAFDPEALIFAVVVNSELIKLYDVRRIDKGPFENFALGPEQECDLTGMKFSRDGKMILLSTNGSIIRILDAFNGTPLKTFAGFPNNLKVPMENSFSSDSQFVFSGSSDGRVHVWKVATGDKVCVLNDDQLGPVQCIQFNPKYMMFASAGANLAFWLPTFPPGV